MNPITLCLCLLLFGVILNLASNNRIIVYYSLFPALLAIGLLMLDNQFAADQYDYIKMFEGISLDNWRDSLTNPGYALLNGIVKALGGDYWTLLFLMNLFAMVIILPFFDRYSPYVAVSWLIYFAMYLGYNLALVRQGLAMSFGLISFRYILAQRPYKYLWCIVLGFFFHYSILLFLPAYWIANRIHIRRKTALILLAVAFPLVLFNFLNLMYWVASQVGVPQWQIDLYLSTEGEHYEQAGLSLGLLVRILFFLGFALTADLEDRLQRVLFNLYFVYLLLYFPLASVSMLSARGLDYYKIFDCLLIPWAIWNIRNVYWRIGYVGFMIAFYVYSVFNQYSLYLRLGNMKSALQSVLDSLQL